MFRRHHLFTALFVTGATTLLACAEDTQATPRVIFSSSIVPGKHPVSECPETGTWFTIGAFPNPDLGREDPANPESPLKDPGRPVEDGANEQSGKVTISCAVVPNGDAFDVRATAELSGQGGGFFQVVGTFRAQGEQPGITVSLAKEGRSYKQNDCVARYTTSTQTVAAGRVWAEIDCPKLEAPSIQRTCTGSMQFRFENCGQ